jgi:hypothetical protein
VTTPQRRNHFRITYEKDKGPRLLYSGHNFSVVDVSEGGIRFLAGALQGFKKDDEVVGTLTFEDKESFIVRGTIVRVDKNAISVQLDKATIPQRKIMAEQRRLIKKYEKFK